jgi:hypothetical protein
MTQDVWLVDGASDASAPPMDGRPGRRRITVVVVLASLLALAGLAVGAVLFLAPSASAFGGCGGG